MFYLFLIPSK